LSLGMIRAVSNLTVSCASVLDAADCEAETCIRQEKGQV